MNMHLVRNIIRAILIGAAIGVVALVIVPLVRSCANTQDQGPTPAQVDKAIATGTGEGGKP